MYSHAVGLPLHHYCGVIEMNEETASVCLNKALMPWANGAAVAICKDILSINSFGSGSRPKTLSRT